MPRLLLRHQPTDLQVDIICRHQLEHQSHERDEVILALLDACPLARDLVMQIGEWVHAHTEEMPPKEGFPNTYTFRIMGFHYLMARSSGRKARQRNGIMEANS
eukprot:symbB.v1.2.005582.t1/scaffold326.1/size228935/4